MNKYSDLVDMNTQAWERSQKTRGEYEDFVASVIGSLMADLEVPGSSWAYADINASAEEAEPTDLPEASGFGEDGWFAVRFLVRFGGGPGPVATIVFLLRARKEKIGWGVRIDHGPDAVLSDDPPYSRLSQPLFESVSTYLGRDLRWRRNLGEDATKIQIAFGDTG
jgi:hypothetical protein